MYTAYNGQSQWERRIFLMERGYTRTALGPLLNIQSYSQENTQYPLDDVFREIYVVDLRQSSVSNTCFDVYIFWNFITLGHSTRFTTLFGIIKPRNTKPLHIQNLIAWHTYCTKPYQMNLKIIVHLNFRPIQIFC